MKIKIKRFCVVLLAFVVLLFASCDKKTPDKGYLTDEQVLEIVEKFSATTDYSKYTYSGSMNFFDKDKEFELPCYNVGRENARFTDSLEKYSTSSTSYYLRMPLHLTEANWTYATETGVTADSTKDKITSILLTIGKTLDEVYYYTDAEGNFIIKTFAANKILYIDTKNSDVRTSAKWNVTITYDKNGYLVSEEFATINAHKDPDSETCYGKATYKFVE